MRIFRKLFARKPGEAASPVTQLPNAKTGTGQTEEQAVIVYLAGTGLPDVIYQDYDLATLEDRLVDAIAASESGEYDGNEFGADGTTLYLYGPNAETLFAAVESTLRGYPSCQNARIVLRYGPPGSPGREVIIGN